MPGVLALGIQELKGAGLGPSPPTLQRRDIRTQAARAGSTEGSGGAMVTRERAENRDGPKVRGGKGGR